MNADIPGKQERNQGFSLLEMFIVLMTIGILAAIIVPALLNGLDRGKQKRTMAELRVIGGAVEAYAVDNSGYPAASDISQLAVVLKPKYLPKLNKTDAWRHGFIFASTVEGYTLGSTGKDGGNALTLIGGGGATKSFDADIVYINGMFVQWPEGTQQ